MKSRTYLSILIGLCFIVSAVLKLLSIDQLEIYIFSLKFFSLDFSSLIARLLIGFELALGFSLVVGFKNKLSVGVAISTVFAFTVFLIYLSIIGRDDNCQCFGAYINLNPINSIIKNIIMIGVLCFAYGDRFSIKIKYWNAINIVLICVFMLLPLLLFPIGKLTNLFLGKSTVNIEMFEEFVSENKLENKKIICFYSTSCEYCLLADKKMALIYEKYGIEDSTTVNVFWQGGNIEEFYKDDFSSNDDYIELDVIKFLSITNGQMPLIVLLNNNAEPKALAYQNISEKEILEYVFE